MASKSRLQAAASSGNGKGDSCGAEQRRAKGAIGTLHGGRPGDEFRIGNVEYRLAADGSFRRNN